MDGAFPDRYVRRFQRWSDGAGYLTMIIGSAVLLGWWRKSIVLMSLAPGLASMKANTALAFLAGGLALRLLHAKAPQHRVVILRRVCALVVIVISALTLGEYLTGWDLGIDQILVRDTATALSNHPGRMAPATVLNFLLLGIALILIDRDRYRAAQALTLAVLALALLAVMGYLYGVESLYQIAPYTSMALHTALTFLVLGLGLLFARPDQAWIAVLSSASAGGILSRRLLPAAVLVPLLVGWARLLGQMAGFYDTAFGVALFASASVVIFTALIAWSATSLARIDRARQQAEAHLRRVSADLDVRVRERTAELTSVNDQLQMEVAERQHAEAKVRALLDATPDAIAIIDHQGSIVLVNAQMETLFGYPRSALLGQSIDMLVPEWFRRVHAEHRTSYFSAPHARVMGAGLDLSGLHANGSAFPVEISLSPVAVAEGMLVAAAIRDITGRNQIEAALRESQARLAILFRNSPAGIALNRLADGHVLEINERFLQLIGFSRDEALGRSMSDLGLLSVAARESIGNQLRAEGSLHDYEVSIRIKSGDVRCFLLSVEVVDVGNEVCGLSILYDITHRKQAEAALRASEAKLRTLFEVLPVGISILDRQRRIVAANPALGRILALSADALSGGAYDGRTYIRPDGTRFPLDAVPSRLAFDEQRTILDVEMGVIVENGQTVWTSVSAAPLPVADLGVVVVITDITERKHAEAALTHERDLLQALMNHVPDMLYFKDTASRFIRINRVQARMLGVHNPRDAIGKTDADFLPTDLAAEFHAEEQQLLQTGKPIIDRPEFNPAADGQPRWFSTTKVPMYDQQGRIAGLIGISRDVTERMRAESALHQANASLRDRVEHMALLNELAEQLQACVTVEEVYTATAALISQIFQAAGALYILNTGRTWVETAIVWGEMPPDPQGFAVQDCWALRRGQPHIVGSSRPVIACQHLRGTSPMVSVCLPLLAQGETLGVLHLRAEPPTDLLGEIQQQLARVVADSVALALANLTLRETLRQQAIHDPLTGLFNRRYLEESLEREVRRAARHQRPMGIIMLDVDHFKQINDTYGHDTGDAVLRQLGRFLQDRIRSDDIICRYGGEEFLIILPEATRDQAQTRAEQQRQDITALHIQHNGRVIDPITLSFGVAAYPDHGATGDSLVRAADAALYRAKRAGRNRVVVAE